MARPPKPDALLATPRRRKAPKADAAVPAEGADAFAAPALLTKGGRAVWARELPRIRQLNLLRTTDLAAFAVYCETSARWEKAKLVLDEGSLTYESVSKHGTMIRVRPEVGIVERCERAMRQFMESLGMTSSSRVRTLGMMASRQLSLPLEPSVPAPAANDATGTPVAKQNDSPIAFLH